MQHLLRYLLLTMALLAVHGGAWSQFTGGAGDGHVSVILASGINCASFFGNQADGHAFAALPNPDPCNNFDVDRSLPMLQELRRTALTRDLHPRVAQMDLRAHCWFHPIPVACLKADNATDMAAAFS